MRGHAGGRAGSQGGRTVPIAPPAGDRLVCLEVACDGTVRRTIVPKGSAVSGCADGLNCAWYLPEVLHSPQH